MRAPKRPAGSSKRPRVAKDEAAFDAAQSHLPQEPGGEADVFSADDVGLIPVVGLGGSAGGIAALQSFFSEMPADSGMAFVVVLHLSPEHESNLAATLQHVTTMPVLQVTETTPVEINRVYVIPPAKHLSISKGRLYLSTMERGLGRHVAVDLLFRSLADHHGPRAVAVMLSGADDDGCIGIKWVKERGGLTVTQDPQEAEQDSMPRTAIATRMVDWVLPAAEIPGRLLEYQRQAKRIRLPTKNLPADPPQANKDAGERALRDVLELLRIRFGHDFSCYKRATVLRRVGRRMQVNGLDEMTAYLGFLRSHPGEAGALQQDLLISVTNFFRDPEAFAALETEIPRLFHGKQPDDTVRVWVAGCATGEEAYSVAMLLREHADRLDAPPKFQVFATDLDENAIQFARAGTYPEAIVADVSPERLRRFFFKDIRGYRVQSALRETVLFALHDLLEDPPFSRLDLVTCRNLLIYLNREAQGRAFEVFHYGLAGQGLLLLGTSESADGVSRLFGPLDKKHRLYLRNATALGSLPLPSNSAASISIRHSLLEASRPADRPVVPTFALSTTASPDRGGELPATWSELHLKLRAALTPPTVIVDASFQVVHLSEGADRFVHLDSGTAAADILGVVHPMLRVELRNLLLRVAQTKAEAQVRDVPPIIGETCSVIRLRVRPADEIAPGHLVVIFEANTPESTDFVPTIGERPDAAVQQPGDASKHLGVPAHKRDESYETSSQELNTGWEELQSINEELMIVNQELKSKVGELAQANGDLANLMASTNIATVFLDRELCIQRYTPSAAGLFNLIPADAGRPLADLSHRLDYPDIIADASRALAQLEQSEKEIQGPAGDWWLAWMRPYRTPSNEIAGVVLTCVDITIRKKAEDDLRRSEAGFRHLADSMPQIVWAAQPDGNADYYNQQWYDFTGFPPGSAGNEQWPEIVHPDDIAVLGARWADSVARGEPFELEFRLKRAADGEYRWFLVRARPVRDVQGEIVRWLGTSTDITERKGAEDAAEATAERLRLAMDAAQLGTWEWDIEANEVFWSREHTAMHDIRRGAERSSFDEAIRHIHPDDRKAVLDAIQKSITTHCDYRKEMRSVRRDGSTHWVVASGRPIYDATGKPLRMFGVIQDITVRKEAEEALRRSEERFRLANIHAPFPVMLHADNGEIIQVNDAWTHQTGYMAEQMVTVRDWIERAYPVPAAQEKAWRFLRQVSDHVGAIESKGRHVRCADGTVRIWDISHANLGRLPDGRCLRITTAIDVTERHEDEVALRLAKEEAEKANRAKSEFLSRMSHELRTPLNAILGFGQILALSQLGTQETQCAEHILKGGKHLLNLIDEVLDLARVEAGELTLKPTAIAVDKLFVECVGFVIKMAEARRVICKVNLRLARRVRVWADEQRFRQVLLNLLGNAIKYNREGGQVTLGCKQMPQGRVRISVRDTGRGITPENLRRLFTPFERLGQELGEVEGTGLGLVVSKQLVEAMGGELEAESEVNRGSTFWVELPSVAVAATDRDASADAGDEADAVPADPLPAKLLYVEDNVSNLQVLQTVVERLRPQWQFLSAKDGQSGLDQAREHLPDLILLDLQLPGLKGDAVLSELRSDSRTARLPVLMLSADATNYSRERLLALGANDYASKPFNVHELLEKLDRILLKARENR